MEIEFEPPTGPSFGDDRVPPEMLQDLLSGMSRPSSDGSAGSGPAERELDLDRLMSGSLDGKPPTMRGGPKTTKWTSPDGSREIVIQQMSPQTRSRVPMELFHSLFPGPLMMDEDTEDPIQSMPFSAPDPLIMDMLQGMNRAFQQDLLPVAHRASGARAPRSCHMDLSKHCSKERSQVHCLGQHQDDISEACRRDVGKSVPFLCSGSIDRYCDVLQTGILACLGEHLQDLDSQCKDAIVATRHVIAKANSQKASVKVKDPQTTRQPALAPLGATALLTASAAPRQGPEPATQTGRSDDSLKLFETTADLVAEATEVAKHNERNSDSSLPWRLVFCVLFLVAAAYAFTSIDGSKRVYSAFKPYMHVDEDSKPLRSGVELNKPLAI